MTADTTAKVAKIVANVFSANGIKVFLKNRTTQNLFAVKHLDCHAIVLTASHNPPNITAIKFIGKMEGN